MWFGQKVQEVLRGKRVVARVTKKFGKLKFNIENTFCHPINEKDDEKY